jgi:hypothetical protein
VGFGNERHHVGLIVDCHLEHFLRRAHFQVHLGSHRAAQKLYVAVLDMLFVFAQMHGNACSACEFCKYCRCNRVRFANLAGFTDGGDMINVKSKFYGHTRLLVISS